MRWGKTYEEQFGWHWWFAWKPVRMGDGRWGWLEGVSRRHLQQYKVQTITPDGQKKIRHHEYRWWETHVRAKMEGTDEQRPSPSNPLGMSAASMFRPTP